MTDVAAEAASVEVTPGDTEPAAQSVYTFKHGVPQPDDGWHAIMHLSTSIDVPVASLDDGQGREFAGDVRVVNGYLFAQELERLTRYEIDERLEWSNPVELSFAAYPVDPNFYWSFPAGDFVYVSYEGYKRLVWDPAAMTIVAAKEDTRLPLELDGLPLSMPGNFSYIRFEDTALMPFNYSDEDGWRYSPTSYVAVYDSVTHDEAAAVAMPCPGLTSLSQDEAGYTYAAPSHSPLAYLYGQGPRPCVARLTPDHALDSAWTTDLTELTGGRFARDFRYVRDGWGLMTVLYHEELGADFSGPVQPEVIERSYEGRFWGVWRVDLVNRTARPIEGLERGTGVALDEIDDRSFLTVTDYGELPWWTRFYELFDDGTVTLHDEYSGEGGWLKVR